MATTCQQSAEQSQQDTWLTQTNTACGATASETNSIRGTRATNARRHTKTGIQTIERVQRSAARFVTGDYRRTSNVSDMCTNLMWNSLYTRRRIRDATVFFLNSPRTNAHQLACHHHHSRCAHQTPTQAQTTNPTSHLHALPAVILHTLYSTVERTYRGSCHRTYR